MRQRLALFLILFCVPTLAQPDGRMTFLSHQLSAAKDPRVRAQAALTLGVSQEPGALPLLCGALKDDSALVRHAAARALSSLQEVGGLACLGPHASDADGDVRDEVQKAVAALTALRQRRPELYVALQAVADGELGSDVARYAEERLRLRLQRMGTVLAPEHENKSQARSVLRERRLKGYELRTALSATAGGGLKLSVLCFTYPEQALLGEVNVNAAGAKPMDLVRALVPRALEEAAHTCNWSP